MRTDLRYEVVGGGRGGFRDPEVVRLVSGFLEKHLAPTPNTKGE